MSDETNNLEGAGIGSAFVKKAVPVDLPTEADRAERALSGRIAASSTEVLSTRMVSKGVYGRAKSVLDDADAAIEDEIARRTGGEVPDGLVERATGPGGLTEDDERVLFGDSAHPGAMEDEQFEEMLGRRRELGRRVESGRESGGVKSQVKQRLDPAALGAGLVDDMAGDGTGEDPRIASKVVANVRRADKVADALLATKDAHGLNAVVREAASPADARRNARKRRARNMAKAVGRRAWAAAAATKNAAAAGASALASSPAGLAVAAGAAALLLVAALAMVASEEGNRRAGGQSMAEVAMGEYLAAANPSAEGGRKYWEYLGFSGRVEWCACFVAWCGNELGYVESGLVPKAASCEEFRSHFEGDPELGEVFASGEHVPCPGDFLLQGEGGGDHIMVSMGTGAGLGWIEGRWNPTQGAGHDPGRVLALNTEIAAAKESGATLVAHGNWGDALSCDAFVPDDYTYVIHVGYPNGAGGQIPRD